MARDRKDTKTAPENAKTFKEAVGQQMSDALTATAETGKEIYSAVGDTSEKFKTDARGRLEGSPYEEYRKPEFSDPVPLPEDKSAVTGKDVQAAFPQLYEKPTTGDEINLENPFLQPAFAPLAEEAEFLGVDLGKRSFPSKIKYAPLLEITEGVDLLGVGFAEEKIYKPYVNYDPRLVTPDISLRDIVDYENNPKAQEALMSFKFFYDRRGRAYKITPGMYDNYEDLVDYADQIGAVEYTNKDGKRRKFPWGSALTKMMAIPDLPEFKRAGIDVAEIRRSMAANNILSYNLADSDLAGPMYARYLNEVLIERGVDDERTRAILINSQIKAPFMGDIRNLVGNLSDNVPRPFVEIGFMGVGEIAQIADSIIQTVPLGAAFYGYDDARPFEEMGLPVNYQDREEIMMKLYDDFPSRLQRYYIQKGADISLNEARILASRYSGLLPRGIQMFAEVRSGTKIANVMKEFRSKGEYRAFQRWSEQRLETDPDQSFAKLLDTWKTETSGFLRTKKGIESRIATYFQVEDARFIPKDQRVEVVEAQKALANATERKAELLQNINIQKSGVTPLMQRRMDAINDNIRIQTNRLQYLERKSSVPKFIRDSNIQDWYLITGSATVGHFLPEIYDVDPELGEFIGILVGAGISISRGSLKNFTDLTATYFGTEAGKSKRRLDYLLTRLTDPKFADPIFQEGLVARGQLIAKYEDQMIAMNVNPDLVSMSIAEILDLAALKYFQQITTDASIRVGKLTSGEALSQLQKNLTRQRTLIASLKERLNNTENLSPQSDFYKMIASTIGAFEENSNSLKKQIDAIDGGSVRYFNDVAKRRDGVKPVPKPDKDFEKVWNDLVENKLLDPNIKPGELALTAKKLRAIQADEAHKAAQNLGKRLLSAPQAAIALQKVKGEPLEVKGIDPVTGDRITMDLTPPEMDSAGQLLAFQLLSKHGVDKGVATKPYATLDNAANDYIYVDNETGASLRGAPQVDVSDIFFALLEGNKDLPSLDKLTKTGYKASDNVNVRGIMNELTDSFFNSVASVQDISKNQVLKNMKATIADTGYVFKSDSGGALQAEISQWLITNKNVGLMTMNMQQLLKFDRGLSSMAYNASGEAVKSRLKTVQASLSDKFDQMVIVDENGVPRPIGNMKVIYNGELEDVSTVLRIAKAGWTRYKNVWYDTGEQGKLVPRLMAWDKQQTGEITTASPFGVDFAINPREWIDVPALFKMSDNQLETYLESFAEALGSRREVSRGRGRTKITSYVFSSSDPESQAFSSIMQVAIAEHLVELAAKGQLGPEQLKGFQNVANKFVFTNKNGKTRPMFSVPKIIDDYIGFDSLDEGIKKQAMERADSEIKKATKAALEPASRHAEIIDSTVAFMEGMLPKNAPRGRLGVADIGDYIRSGGQVGFDMMVDALSTGNPKYSKNEILGILREAYIRDMVMESFEETGRSILNADGVLIPESGHDAKVLSKYLGVGNPEQEQFIRNFLDFDIKSVAGKPRGKSYYDNARAVAGFLSELKDDPLTKSIGIDGIPRSMSVESYISRFYAINRGVVRPQYVGTEAVLQQMRFGKFSFIKSVISDPELSILFLESVRTGRPLDAKRTAQFEALLIQAMGRDNALYGGEQPEVITDDDGNRILVYAQRGYYKNDKAMINYLGRKDAAKGFPEMRRSREQLEEAGVTTGMFSAIQ